MHVNQRLLGQDVFKVADFCLEVKRDDEFAAVFAGCTRWSNTTQ